MKCPACDNELTTFTLGRLEVDVCRGACGGIWFDNFELLKVDDPEDFAGSALLEVERDVALSVDQHRRRHCPRCETTVMMRHFYSDRKRVIVDTCPKCGGVWLDGGELALIRAECEHKPDRHAAAQTYFRKMFQSDWARLRGG